MKKKLAFVAILTGILMTFSVGFAACGGGDKTGDEDNKPGIVNPDDDDKDDDKEEDDNQEKKVNKIAIKTEPTKTEYWTGEQFSVEGGVITVTYRDKSTEDISMTDERVEVAAVNMDNAIASKAVKVTFENKSATFYIKIKAKGGVLKFDYNYQNAPAATEVQTEKDTDFTSEEAPDAEREGYTFDKWYTDAACTVEYIFNSPVDSNTTVYAGWKQDGVTYFSFTYNLNYYGVAVDEYTQLVKSGEKARALGLTPSRNEFEFGGWFTDAACTTAIDADAAIAKDTTVYAKWTKTKQGSSSYTFEAENVSMEGQEGPGFSGAAGGSGMMVTAKNEGVSGKVVSYLYADGIHVDFCLASSEDATATLTFYVCAEIDGVKLNPDKYEVKLINADGETKLSYAETSLVSGGAVVGITIQNVQLTEGANTISLITHKLGDSDKPAGGTYETYAPMVDRITLETEAVVIWDGAKGMPWNNGI